MNVALVHVARNFIRTVMSVGDRLETDDNFKGTPERVVAAWGELTRGLAPDYDDQVKELLSVVFPSGYSGLVVVPNIHAAGVCPHHILPVEYNVSIGYLPATKVLGLSKIPRLIKLMAARPIMQETLTTEIVQRIQTCLDPGGVIVRVSGRHSCMSLRGVREPASRMITQDVSGLLLKDGDLKQEFVELVKEGG